TTCYRDWSSDVCSSDLKTAHGIEEAIESLECNQADDAQKRCSAHKISRHGKPVLPCGDSPSGREVRALTPRPSSGPVGDAKRSRSEERRGGKERRSTER